jgi:hypothetical protein
MTHELFVIDVFDDGSLGADIAIMLNKENIYERI